MRIWRGGTICGNGRKDEGIAFHPTVRTLNTVSAPTALGRGSVLSPLGTPTTILDAHCFTHFQYCAEFFNLLMTTLDN